MHVNGLHDFSTALNLTVPVVVKYIPQTPYTITDIPCGTNRRSSMLFDFFSSFRALPSSIEAVYFETTN